MVFPFVSSTPCSTLINNNENKQSGVWNAPLFGVRFFSEMTSHPIIKMDRVHLILFLVLTVIMQSVTIVPSFAGETDADSVLEMSRKVQS